MHFSSKPSSNAVNLGIVAKSHPAFVKPDEKAPPSTDAAAEGQQPPSKKNTTSVTNSKSSSKLQQSTKSSSSDQVASTSDGSKQQNQKHVSSVLGDPLKTNFEVVSLRSPKPPAAAQTARVVAAANMSSEPHQHHQSSSSSTPDHQKQQQGQTTSRTPSETDGGGSNTSRALVPTPTKTNNGLPGAPLIVPPSPSSSSVVVANKKPSSDLGGSSSSVVVPVLSNNKLSDSRLPVVGGNIKRLAGATSSASTLLTSPLSSSQPAAKNQLLSSPSSTANSTTVSSVQLPPIRLAQSSIMLQQLQQTLGSEPFASTLLASPQDPSSAVTSSRQQQNNNNNNNNNNNALAKRGSDIGAALTVFSPPTPNGPLRGAAKTPRHWTELLPTFTELEASSPVVNGGSTPTSQHAIPPLAAELLSFIRRELKMIYEPLFEVPSATGSSNNNNNNNNNNNTAVAEGATRKGKASSAVIGGKAAPEQAVQSPDIKLARWRVYMDAFRCLCEHFKEYRPLLFVMAKEFEDMFAAVQHHASDRALFSMVANNTEEVASTLAKETTKSVFEELALTKTRNKQMQLHIQQLEKDTAGIRERLADAIDDKTHLKNDLERMSERAKTFMEALQGEANRQNAAYAEAKAIKDENVRLKANVQSLQEQAKKDTFLHEELFSKLDQVSMTMREAGYDISPILQSQTTPSTNNNNNTLAMTRRGGGGGGGDDYYSENVDNNQLMMSGARGAAPENAHSLEGMRRWGSSLFRVAQRRGDDQDDVMNGDDDDDRGNNNNNGGGGSGAGGQQQQGGGLAVMRRRADRRLSTILGTLEDSKNKDENDDDDEDNENPQMVGDSSEISLGGAGRSRRKSRGSEPGSPASVTTSVISNSSARANEMRRDRAAMDRERMIKESMKFAASCAGDSVAERLQEALLRCFGKVRKYRGTIGVLRQTITRLEKKIQKISVSAMQQQQSSMMLARSSTSAFAQQPVDFLGGGGGGGVGVPGGSMLQPSWSMVAPSQQASGVFDTSGSMAAFGGGSLSSSSVDNKQGASALKNKQQLELLKPSEVAQVARFESERPLTPRPMWNRLSGVLKGFSVEPDPESGVMPCSDDVLEGLADKLRNLQSEALREVEKKVLSKRVSGWLEDEQGNTKTHQVRSAKASDITSLLMASSRSFVGLGTGPEVPLYLRYSGRLRNKLLGKGDVELLLKRFWRARRESMLPSIGEGDDDAAREQKERRNSSMAIDDSSDLGADLAMGNTSFTSGAQRILSEASSGLHEGSYAMPIDDFYQQWLQQTTGNPKSAIELAYSINDVCDRYQHDPDCGMFLKIMRGLISEQCLSHEMYSVDQLKRVFTDLDSHNAGQLPRSLVYRVLKQLFPSKRYGEGLRLRFALIPFTDEDEQGHATVRYLDLFEEDAEGNQTTFVERLRHQHFDEALEILVEIETSVRETAQTTGARGVDMPLWQIAHSIRNVDARMPTSAILHILSVGSRLPASVCNDAIDRHASDIKVDIEDFFNNVRRGVYVRRYSPPPEDDLTLLEDEADDADVEDAEDADDDTGVGADAGFGGGGGSNNRDQERLDQLVREEAEREAKEIDGPFVDTTPQARSFGDSMTIHPFAGEDGAASRPPPPPRSPLDPPFINPPRSPRVEGGGAESSSPTSQQRSNRSRQVTLLTPQETNASFSNLSFADGMDLVTL